MSLTRWFPADHPLTEAVAFGVKVGIVAGCVMAVNASNLGDLSELFGALQVSGLAAAGEGAEVRMRTGLALLMGLVS